MLITIVIPVFNEVNTIATVLQQVEAVILSCAKEIIIVDDFSTDGTRDLLQKLDVNGTTRVSTIIKTRGKELH